MDRFENVMKWTYTEEKPPLPAPGTLDGVEESQFDEVTTNLLDRVAIDMKEYQPCILIFIACGIGGIILKKALNEASKSQDSGHREVLERTSLIIFCGTPHRVCANRSCESILYELLSKHEQRNINQWTSERINQLKDVHISIGAAFEELSGRFRVVSYYQDDPIDGEYDLISPKCSATLGWKQEIHIALHRHHDLIRDFEFHPDDRMPLDTLIKNAWLERGEKHTRWLQMLSEASSNTASLEITYPAFQNFCKWLLSSVPSFFNNNEDLELTSLSHLAAKRLRDQAYFERSEGPTLCRLSIRIPGTGCNLAVLHSSLVSAIESKYPYHEGGEDLFLNLHSISTYPNPTTKVKLIASLCSQILKGHPDVISRVRLLYEDVSRALKSVSVDLQEFWLWKCFTALIRACSSRRTHMIVYEPRDAQLIIPFAELYDSLRALLEERDEIQVKCLFIRFLESSDECGPMASFESQITASVDDEMAAEALKKDHLEQIQQLNLTQPFKALLVSENELQLPQLTSHPLDSVLLFTFLKRRCSQLLSLGSIKFYDNNLMDDATALVLGSIPISERQIMRAGLIWITHGARPLTVSEFSAALIASSESDGSTLGCGETLTERFIHGLCGLVQMRENYLCLACSTLTDRVTNPNSAKNEWYEVSSENANEMLARTCMRCIQLEGARRCQTSLETSVPPKKDDPLIPYAVKHWLNHARMSGISMAQDIVRTFRQLEQSFLPTKIDTHLLRDEDSVAWDPELLSNHFKQYLPLDDCTEVVLAGRELEQCHPWNAWSLATLAACQRGKKEIAAHLLQQLDATTYQDTMREIFETSPEPLLRSLVQSQSPYAASNLYSLILTAAELGQQRLLEDLLRMFPEDQGIAYYCLKGWATKGCLIPSMTDHIWTLLSPSNEYLHKVDVYGNTLLHLAATSGHVSLIEKLVQLAIDVNRVNAHGKTALFLACEHGHQIITGILLRAGTHHTPAIDEGTPLHAACSNGSNKIVRMLLETSVPLFEVNVQKQTPLHVALEKRQFSTALLLVKALETTDLPLNEPPTIGNHARLDLQDHKGSSALHFACRANNLPIVTALLECGANPNIVDNKGRSAVFFAMKYGYLEIFTQLLNHKAHVHIKDPAGFSWSIGQSGIDKVISARTVDSPLYEAASFGQIRIIKEMLQKLPPGPDNQVDLHSALISACHRGHTEIALLLLSHYLIQDFTPFAMEAAKMGWGKLACELWSRELSNINAHDPTDQNTPLHYAALNNLPELSKILLSRGAQMNLSNRSGRTPLGGAVASNSIDVVKMLVEAGADVNADQDGDTALFIAAIEKHVQILRTLILAAGNSLDIPQRRHNKDYNTFFDFILLKGEPSVFSEVMSLPIEIEVSGTALYALISREEDEGKALMRIEALAQRGVNINMEIGPLGGLLHYTAVWGKFKLINGLLNPPDGNPLDVNKVNSRGESPLQLAAGFYTPDRLEIIKLLFDKGAERDFSSVTPTGRDGTPLHAALKISEFVTAPYLLKVCPGLSLNTRDQEGRLPLHMAAMSRFDADAFRQLSNDGGLLREKDYQGRNALHLASAHVAHGIINFILKKCPEMINETDNDGWTALHWACKGGDRNTFRSLVRHGAEAGARTTGGWLPQDVAIWHHRADILEYSLGGLPNFPIATQGESDEIETSVPVTTRRQLLDWKTPQGYSPCKICDSCRCGIYGVRSQCKTCQDVNFCFKCARHVDKIHYTGHKFDKITSFR